MAERRAHGCLLFLRKCRKTEKAPAADNASRNDREGNSQHTCVPPPVGKTQQPAQVESPIPTPDGHPPLGAVQDSALTSPIEPAAPPVPAPPVPAPPVPAPPVPAPPVPAPPAPAPLTYTPQAAATSWHAPLASPRSPTPARSPPTIGSASAPAPSSSPSSTACPSVAPAPASPATATAVAAVAAASIPGPPQDATTIAAAAANTNDDGENKEEADDPACALRALSTTSHASTVYLSAGGWSQFGEDGEWLGARPPSSLLMSGSHGDFPPSEDHPPPPGGPNHHHHHQVHQHLRAPSSAVPHCGAAADSANKAEHGDALRGPGMESSIAQQHTHTPAMTTTSATTATTTTGQDCHERGQIRGQHPPSLSQPTLPLSPLQQDYHLREQQQQKHQSQQSGTLPPDGGVQPAATLVVAVVQEPTSSPSPAFPQNCQDQDQDQDNSADGSDNRNHQHQHQHHQLGFLCCSGDNSHTTMPTISVKAALAHGDDSAGTGDGRGVPAEIAAAREDGSGGGVHDHVNPVLDLVSELYAAQGRPCRACQVLLQYCKAQGRAPESLREELRARELPDVETLTKVAQGVSDGLADLASDEGWQLIRNDDLRLLYKPLPSQGVHAFRARCVVDAPVEHLVSLLREVDMCPTWNKFCTSAYLLRELSATDVLAYLSLWVPWPLNDVGFLVEAHGADLFEEEGRLVVCFKSPEGPSSTTTTITTAAANTNTTAATNANASSTASSAAVTPRRGVSPHSPSSSPPPPPLPPLPPGTEGHRRIRLLARSCMVFEPLTPKVPGGQPRTRCAVQMYVDPGIRHVPPFVISFVLKVLSPFIYTAVLKVLATAFKSPNNPLPKRIQERSYLYGLVRRRTDAYLQSKAAALDKQADGAAPLGGAAGGGGGG